MKMGQNLFMKMGQNITHIKINCHENIIQGIVSFSGYDTNV